MILSSLFWKDFSANAAPKQLEIPYIRCRSVLTPWWPARTHADPRSHFLAVIAIPLFVRFPSRSLALAPDDVNYFSWKSTPPPSSHSPRVGIVSISLRTGRGDSSANSQKTGRAIFTYRICRPIVGRCVQTWSLITCHAKRADRVCHPNRPFINSLSICVIIDPSHLPFCPVNFRRLDLFYRP